MIEPLSTVKAPILILHFRFEFEYFQNDFGLDFTLSVIDFSKALTDFLVIAFTLLHCCLYFI